MVDDGSTDDSAEIAQSFSTVRYIYQKNQGLASARNTGILAAHSSHVALLDSDDEWLPTYLENMLPLIAQAPNATVYYCAAHCIDPAGQRLAQIIGGVRNHTKLLNQMLRFNHIIPSTVVLQRKSIIEAGLFDVAFRRLQDRELWVRLLKQGQQFAGLATALVRYRVHDESLSADGGGGCAAVFALTHKHYGADDGQYESWDNERRRAFAGAHCSCALTQLQREKDWDACFENLNKALTIDPSLATDFDLFYELALGVQALGRRGQRNRLRLEHNAFNIKQWITINARILPPKLPTTAYRALATVAYNTQQFPLCRHFVRQLLRHNPPQIFHRRVFALALKAHLGGRLLNLLRMARQRIKLQARPQFVATASK